MSLIYVLIAIAFGGAQYFFVYLANRQGRNDALQKTEENLVSIFQNLDSTSKKEFLLNADLNKDEIIYLVNNQTKNSAVEIISTTLKEFQIVQKDLDKKDEQLDGIGKTTSSIENKIDEVNKNINIKDFTISFIANVSGRNAVSALMNLNENLDFNIWITFKQNDIEMLTFLKSKGKWLSNNNIRNEEKIGSQYEVTPAAQRIIVRDGGLQIDNKNSLGKFKSDKKIFFEIHQSGDFDFSNVFGFSIRTPEGKSIPAKNIEHKVIPFKIVKDIGPELKIIETSKAITGYFEFE